MNEDMQQAFSRVKPLCDLIMVNPSPEHISTFAALVCELRTEVLQELQQYLLFPFISHLQNKDVEYVIRGKFELQRILVDGMKVVLQRIRIYSFEMAVKIESSLIGLVFEKPKPGMVPDAPEELKLSVIQCLTMVMLNVDHPIRVRMVQTQVPILAQGIFVSVHLAKLEKLRALRLASINCLCAHTASHPQLTDEDGHINDPVLEIGIVNMMSCIVPGVMGALQDVATCKDNPGHAIVVAALNATHRVLCVTMHNKHMPRKDVITADDFVTILSDRSLTDKEASRKARTVKSMKRTPEWYISVSDKLNLVVKGLVPLVNHEHYKVRKELAVLCFRIISECSSTMPLSLTMALDVLITLSNDPYKEVSDYASNSVDTFFNSQTSRSRTESIDSMCENFFTTLNCLPRILNNIEAHRKLSALQLLAGYLRVLGGARPQRLTGALCASDGYDRVCDALQCAATQLPRRDLLVPASSHDITSPPPADGPWRRLLHLDTPECESKFQEICELFGGADCAELLLDRLLELFHERRSLEVVYVINFVASAPQATPSLAHRVVGAYSDEDVWYQPLGVGAADAPLTADDTLDVDVYDPRAWTRDSVPGLFEGTVETRYTDISLTQPRVKHVDPNTCASLAEAQRNMAFCCLVTEGLGLMAKRLKRDYQPHLLKTLCLLLERVGSQYQYLHQAGLLAINNVAFAFDHKNVPDLIAENADYFTSQITSRLKRPWDTESALQILSVVMEYSDKSILDCLYGIVEDVLVQSCDKYYEDHLRSYLQVFETFIKCIRNWFPNEEAPATSKGVPVKIDVIKEAIAFVNNSEEVNRLLNREEFEEENGRSVEEMYKEDLKRREEEVLDYDDAMGCEAAPAPPHVRVSLAVLRRCVHFVSSARATSAPALRVLALGLPVLRAQRDLLLPLAHALWAPLAARVAAAPASAPAWLREALALLLALAALAGDFVRARAARDVLPVLYKFLKKAANDSHLKDTGSAYRISQAYYLQVAMLTALPSLVTDLMLDGERLDDAMACAQIYLSKNQPKPLQILAVKFFKDMLSYNYGAAWNHLRKLCANDCVLSPPRAKYIRLEAIVGSPYETVNTNYDSNVKLIFYVHK